MIHAVDRVESFVAVLLWNRISTHSSCCGSDSDVLMAEVAARRKLTRHANAFPAITDVFFCELTPSCIVESTSSALVKPVIQCFFLVPLQYVDRTQNWFVICRQVGSSKTYC